jgi:hypothetical protein
MPESMTSRLTPTARHRDTTALVLATLAAVVLAACGGGGPLDNAPTLANATGAGAGVSGQTLSFAYFQECVKPMITQPLPAADGSGTNTCSSSGCHDNAYGTGGALRLLGSANKVKVASVVAASASSPEAAVVRASEMIYRNFYSALGETVVNAPDQSRLLNKPLVRGVLHGGGLIFASPDDEAAKRIRYWINRPMPQGQDEFSEAAFSMFDPPFDKKPGRAFGACNSN